MFSIVLFFVFGAILFYYWLWTSTYWSRRGIQGPNGMPVFGNMINYLTGRRHYGYVYEDIYKNVGFIKSNRFYVSFLCRSFPDAAYIGMYRLFNEPAILLRSLDMIKEVMIKSFSSFHDNVLYIDEKRDSIIMCDPFVARGDKWRLMRNEIVPIFTPNKVKLSFHHIHSICRKLDTYLELTAGQTYEAKDLCSKYTLDVVTSAACGLSLGDTKSDLTKLVENLFMPNPFSLFETTALLFVPLLGRLIKYRYIPIKIQNWLSMMVRQVLFERMDPRNHQNNQSDFIQWLIDAKQKANEPINEHIMTGHCATFLLEGFETSASLMTFVLYQLATNIHVQDKVHEEVDRVMSKYNGHICYDAIMEMTYLEAVLYETLRLYPPMLALLKQCTKPFELPSQYNGTQLRQKVVLKVGTVVIVPVKAIHYNPEIYAEPYEFNPERFTESNKRQRANCAFLGFGEGPRMCPGMRFGLTQSKAGLATILKKYWVVLSPKCKEFRISATTFLTSSKDGIWICLKPR